MDMELARQVREEYEAGATLQALSKKHRRRQNTISKLVRAAGGETRPKGRPLRVLSEADQDRLCTEYKAGATAYRLGRRFHLATKEVYALLKARGIEIAQPEPLVWAAQAQRLFEAGQPVTAIARAVGRSPQRVREVAQLRGWKRPPA